MNENKPTIKNLSEDIDSKGHGFEISNLPGQEQTYTTFNLDETPKEANNQENGAA